MTDCVRDVIARYGLTDRITPSMDEVDRLTGKRLGPETEPEDCMSETKQEPDEIEERIEQMAVRAASGDWWQSKVADTTRSIVRDAIAELDGALQVSRRRNEAREQRIIQLAAAVEASRDVRLERDKLKAANVALGHEKELALAEAYRENERLRAELAAEKRMLGNLLAVIHRDGGHHQGRVGTAQACKDAEEHVRTARQDAREFARAIDNTYNVLRDGTLPTRISHAMGILEDVDTSNYVDGGE